MTATVIESGRDRVAMRRVLSRSGFGHALDSVVDALVTELVADTAPDADDRMAAIAKEAETVVLDGLIAVARKHGWRAG